MYSSLSSKEQYVWSFPKWMIWQPRLEHLSTALSPKCSAKMNNSSCVEGWTNYFLLVSDLSNRYPNSFADWRWQTFSEEVANCTKPQNPKMKHIYHSRHFAKQYLVYSKALEPVYATMRCVVSGYSISCVFRVPREHILPPHLTSRYGVEGHQYSSMTFYWWLLKRAV